MHLQGNHPDVQYSNIPDWNIPIVRVDILESRQKTFLHFPSLNNTCVFPFPRACPITITVTPCPSFEICTMPPVTRVTSPPCFPNNFTITLSLLLKNLSCCSNTLFQGLTARVCLKVAFDSGWQITDINGDERAA